MLHLLKIVLAVFTELSIDMLMVLISFLIYKNNITAMECVVSYNSW